MTDSSPAVLLVFTSGDSHPGLVRPSTQGLSDLRIEETPDLIIISVKTVEGNNFNNFNFQ